MWKRALLVGALGLFLISTAKALAEHSYVGFFVMANANSATRLLMLDVVLALSLIGIWMVRDARARGGAFMPFLLLAALFGVAGPLLYLVSRELRKSYQRALAWLMLVVLCGVAGSSWHYADLRNDIVKAEPPNAAREGEELLQRVAERLGLKAWTAHGTMEVVATDYWSNAGWWPEPKQRFRSQAILRTFTSRVELLDGQGAGQVLGLQAWAPYRAAPGDAKPTFIETPVNRLSIPLSPQMRICSYGSSSLFRPSTTVTGLEASLLRRLSRKAPSGARSQWRSLESLSRNAWKRRSGAAVENRSVAVTLAACIQSSMET